MTRWNTQAVEAAQGRTPLLCRLGWHRWRYEDRCTSAKPAELARATTFHLRFCRRCGAEQIRCKPFMGDASWLQLDPWPVGPFPSVTKREQELFANATAENQRLIMQDSAAPDAVFATLIKPFRT